MMSPTCLSCGGEIEAEARGDGYCLCCIYTAMQNGADDEDDAPLPLATHKAP